MANIAIVTDSTADLPQDEIRRWGIEVVPAVLIIDGKTLTDGRDISRAELYRRLPAMHDLPTTAAPPPGAFAEVYERLLERGAEAVFSIHLAQSLSGLFDMALKAAEEFDQRVAVFDSQQASLALGFQVLEAAQAAAQGADLASLIELAHGLRQRSRLAAMVDKVRYLRLSGRVGWLRGSVGEVLNLRVVIEVTDGHVQRVDWARTRRRGVESLMARVGSWGRLARVAAMHVADPDGASVLAGRLVSLCGCQPLIAEATTIIGTHVGPGAVGVAALVA
jgi:DegV family protein with EDD domain